MGQDNVMQPLSNQTLSSLQGKVTFPDYRLQARQPGIGLVHLGPGAFFRGHQAWYTEQALKQGGDWGICAVSMRSGEVAKALNPQDGLYTLVELDSEIRYQVIGAVQKVLVAAEQYAEVLAQLSAAETRFVTLTITEKGYCLNAAGELDLQHPEIRQDLKRQTQPITAIGLLVTALQARYQAGEAPFCAISCDNLTDNGHKLKRALVRFAREWDPVFASWLQSMKSPCTMVDSITPATDDALRQQVANELGLADAWPIKRESFLQWVIEDDLPAERPDWQSAGVIFAADVSAFEKAKLRLLNAPHSTLAYLGCLLGYETVSDAMQDDTLVALIKRMIAEDLMPSFRAPAELDAGQYSADILQRFQNPAIRHLLAQIAWDGSQKLPMRLLPAVRDNLASGSSIRYLALAVAAWCRFICLRQQSTVPLVDPLAEQLLAVAASCTGDATADVARFLRLSAVFGRDLATEPRFVEALTEAYQHLTDGVVSALSHYTGVA